MPRDTASTAKVSVPGEQEEDTEVEKQCLPLRPGRPLFLMSRQVQEGITLSNMTSGSERQLSSNLCKLPCSKTLE